MDDLTSHERKALEILNGDRPAVWGAWVSACLEVLAGAGLCTRGPRYSITEAGKQALIPASPQPEQHTLQGQGE